MSVERKFIHDLAAPLSTAIFAVESISDAVAKHADPALNLDVEALKETLGRIRTLLEERRSGLLRA